MSEDSGQVRICQSNRAACGRRLTDGIQHHKIMDRVEIAYRRDAHARVVEFIFVGLHAESMIRTIKKPADLSISGL
jgi:hypothetical protein